MAETENKAAAPRDARPRSTASIFGHPIHTMLVPFPVACFVGALLTDITYAESANILWSTFSVWLIAAGLLMGGLAAVAGLVDYFGDRRIRRLHTATIHMLLNIAVFVIELFNVFIHSRDGWTAVVPTGLTLSAIAVVLLCISAWLGGALVFKHGVGQGR